MKVKKKNTKLDKTLLSLPMREYPKITLALREKLNKKEKQ